MAIAVAAWYTGGLVSGMITDTASAGTFEFVSAEQAAAINTANALAPAAGGAASGFAAGGLQGGNLQSAVASAVSGVIAGGINGFYGSKYPIDRIAANSVSGGISSALQGGRFQDGFKSSLTTSLLTYANVQMRQSQIELSLRDPEGRSDGRGWSRGLFGDLFKLGGGRYDDADRSACSPFGCQQRGPGSIAGIPYASGGLIDMVVESFAGPHDSANQRWFYNSLGQIREMSNRQSLVGELFGNYSTSLIFAAPFAIAAVREQTFYGAYKYAGR